MSKNRKILLVVFILLLALIPIRNTFAIGPENQDETINLSDELFEYFGEDRMKNSDFPEEFGGYYINDDNYLVIQLTDEKYVEEYKKIFSNPEYVKFEIVDWSFVDIQNTLDEFMDKNDEIFNNDYSYYVDVITNSGVIETSFDNLDDIKELIDNNEINLKIESDKIISESEENKLINRIYHRSVYKMWYDGLTRLRIFD